ncbi:Oidioi.mRNA.OKI2018_I69.XSR.g15908.t1.cds [Oikopleura dioica]|uniref:1-acylglycerol-3-phosphate O-acyltransferase n=1 Tax=Oikopleura dioica TaxID=34765 RepID=A0ABN7SEC7_OIKDI|nr:Oidioi.mRNA.OKI2018_I69.XSR.g15908.t1.cds [Oikopleura dioica]
MRVWLFYLGFYGLLRGTIVKSSPRIDIIFRRIEFFLVAQILVIPVLVYQLLANAKFEATRIVPFFMSIIWRTKIDIRGEIPNENCVIVCNHQSGLDICPLLKFIPLHGSVVTKASLAKSLGPVSVVFHKLGLTFIDRSDREQALATMNSIQQRLSSSEKYCIVIFPEGTRAPTKELLPFKVGAFQTALRARVPIVPIVIANHEDYAGRDVLPIQILDPIYPKHVNSEEIGAAARELSLKTRQKMGICYKNLSDNLATAKS